MIVDGDEVSVVAGWDVINEAFTSQAENSIFRQRIGEDYVNNSPFRTKLIPFTVELLNALKKYYKLHIITNGFEEVQHIKLRESGLNHYFNKVITSEMVGAKKPS